MGFQIKSCPSNMGSNLQCTSLSSECKQFPRSGSTSVHGKELRHVVSKPKQDRVVVGTILAILYEALKSSSAFVVADLVRISPSPDKPTHPSRSFIPRGRQAGHQAGNTAHRGNLPWSWSNTNGPKRWRLFVTFVAPSWVSGHGHGPVATYA